MKIPIRVIRAYLKAKLNPLPASPREWIHASGNCICSTCGHLYFNHPEDPNELPLHVLCDGLRVKL